MSAKRPSLRIVLPRPPSARRPWGAAWSVAFAVAIVAGAFGFPQLSGPTVVPGSAASPLERSAAPTPLLPSSQGVLAPAGTTAFHSSAPVAPPLASGVPHAPTALPLPGTAAPRAAPAGIRPAATSPVVTISVNGTGSLPGELHLNASIEGENYYQASATPPDVQVGSSASQVVEMVNLEFAAWSTDGTKIGNESLYTFWGVSTSTAFLSDPRILYDADSGRWFASILEATSSGYSATFAVSTTGSATGTWTVYSTLVPVGGDLGDQPILGVSHDLVSLGVNDFSSSGYAGAQYWVVNKSAVLAGTSAAFARFGPYVNDLSIHPVVAAQPYNGMWLVETLPGTPGTLAIFSVAGVPPATPTVTRTNLTVGNLASPPAAAQPGTTDQLDTGAGSARVQDAVWANGHLWVVYSDSCLVGGVTHACFRLDEVNTSGTPSVFQDFDVAVSGTDLLYPAIALDPSGDLVLVFGMSSSTTYPSIGATFRAPSDALDTVRNGILVRAGSASMGCGGVCRYGDYFGASLRPGSSTVWLAGEYVTSSAPWQTRLASVSGEGPMAARLSTPLAAGDVGESIPISIDVTNSTCPSGASYACSAVVPFGDGVTGYVNCTTLDQSFTLHHVYASPGPYTIGVGGQVTVYSSPTCAAGSAATTINLSALSITIASAQVVQVSATPSTSVDVGQNVSLTAQVSGGVGPYSFLWYGLPSGCTVTTGPTVDCTMRSAGDFVVNVTSVDANQGSSVGTVAVHVDPAPSVTLAAAPAATDVGQPLQLLGTPSGGSGAYQYGWSGLPTGCVGPADSPSLVCTPSGTGTFPVRLLITDSRGVSNQSAIVRVKVAPELSVALPSTPALVPNVAFTIQSNVNGGTGPFSYVWQGLPPGCPPPTTSTVTCSAAAGSYTVTVVVTDAAGATAQASLTLSVGGTSGSSGGALLEALLGVVLVAAIVGGALGVLMLRRRRAPPRT